MVGICLILGGLKRKGLNIMRLGVGCLLGVLNERCESIEPSLLVSL